jgi:hypothetical protein
MRLTGLNSAVRRRQETLASDSPERKLFEAWALDKNTGGWARDLARSKSNPARYAVEQVNTDFEAFTLGLMCGQRGNDELQSLVQADASIGPL